MAYHQLSTAQRRRNSVASARLGTLSGSLSGNGGRVGPWEPDVQERRRLVDALLEDLDAISPQAAWRSWQDATTLSALGNLKLLGRTPVGTTSLTSKSALMTLLFHCGLASSTATHAASPIGKQIAEEAIRILANGLLLHPLARVEEGVWTEAVCEALVNRAFPSQLLPAMPASTHFLPSRLLYLLTASPSEGVVVLVDGTSLIPRLAEALEGVVGQLQRQLKGYSTGALETIEEQVWTEWLKTLFNTMVQYSRSLSLYPRVFSPSPGHSPSASPLLDTDPGDALSDGHSSSAIEDAELPPIVVPPEAQPRKRPRPFPRGSGSFLKRATSPAPPAPSKSAALPGRSESPSTSGSSSESPVMSSQASLSDRTDGDSLHVPAAPQIARMGSDMSSKTLKSGDSHDTTSWHKPRVLQRFVEGMGELGGRVLGRGGPSSGVAHGGRRRNSKEKRRSRRRGTGASDGTADTTAADLDAKFEPVCVPVVDLYLLLDSGDPPTLQSPLMPVIQALLNFSPSQPAFARSLPAGAPSFAKFSAPSPSPLPVALAKTLALVEAVLKTYSTDDGTILDPPHGGTSSTPMSESFTQVVVLLSNLVAPHALLDASQREALRGMIVPRDLARDEGLDRDKSGLFVGRLLRVMNGVTGASDDNLRGAIGAFLMRLWDNDAAKLVSAIGYGPLAGYLTSIGQGGIQPDPTTLRDDVNPMTGAKWQTDSVPASLDMTDEEKAQEAERLGDLFDRLNRTGVMKVQDPRQAAVEDGRFQELTDEAEEAAKEAEAKELREAEEDIRRYKQRKEALRQIP